LTVQI